MNSFAAGPVCEEPEMDYDEYEEVYNSVTGAMLDPKMVADVRKEEIEWIHHRKIYEVAS